LVLVPISKSLDDPLRYRSIHWAILLAFLFPHVAPHAEAGRPRGRRPPPFVSVEKAIRRTVRSQLTVVGTVAPYRLSIVSSEIEGRVETVPVREGDPVVAGETIIASLRRTDLEIDLRIEKAELAKAFQDYLRLKRGNRPEEIQAYRARLREKEAELKRDELELKRAKDLFEKKILNRSAYDRAIAEHQISKSKYAAEKYNLRISEIGPRKEEVAKARAEVARMKARVAGIEDKLGKAVILSPLTGFLTEKSLEVGQWVSKGGKAGEVIEIQKVLVRASVPERQISSVRVGDSAKVTLDALPNRKFRGRIARIIPKADTKSRTFPVEIELQNTPEYTIKVGMFARIVLEYGAAVSVLLVPKDALLIRPRGASVFIFEKGKVREVSFRPGRNVDSFVEVPGELIEPGMMIVVQGNEKLRGGMKVRLKGQRRRPGARGGKGGRPARGSTQKGGRG
jgi:multidrug efflux pump subunit AcrA (membrane-fusion protein)